MDGEYNSSASAQQNIAGLIRSANAGLCSGEPAGVRYPGVPSTDEVLHQLGVEAGDRLTESQWYAACDIVEPG